MLINLYNTNLVKLIIIILLLVILCACKANKSYIKKVDVIKISKDFENNSITYIGTIKAINNPILSFQSEGKIVYLPYSKGDYIKKGTVIASLDGTLYKIQRKEAKSRLDEANIRYTRSQRYYDRMNTLHKAGGISDNDWEEAYFSLKTNKQNIDIEREKVNYLDKQISYNTIVAPFNGVISEKYSEIGNYVSIGEPVVKFNKDEKNQVEIMVDDSNINFFKIGQIVTIKKDDKTYIARVAHISKTSENDGGYLIKIYFNDTNKEFLEGMNVDVIVKNNLSNSILIPISCVFEENNEKFVYRVFEIENNFGKIQKQRIKTRNIFQNKIEVVDGLDIGDLVVLDNLSNLKEGLKVSL